MKSDSVYNNWYERCHTQQHVERLARLAAANYNFTEIDVLYLKKYTCEVRSCQQQLVWLLSCPVAREAVSASGSYRAANLRDGCTSTLMRKGDEHGKNYFRKFRKISIAASLVAVINHSICGGWLVWLLKKGGYLFEFSMK